MRIPILMFGATLALGACSTLKADDPPVCDGRHRRPANLYGSVLAPAQTPSPIMAPDMTAEPGAPVVVVEPTASDGGCA